MGLGRTILIDLVDIMPLWSFAFDIGEEAGVISRGAHGGGAPLVKISHHVGGAQPP